MQVVVHNIQKCAVIYVCALISKICLAQNCPNGAPITFAKISSLIPRTNVQPELLYATTAGTAITAECYNRCSSSDDCAGFLIDYQRSSCFRMPLAGMNTGEYVLARNSNFFLKVCVQVPANCSKKAWSMEFAPNSELVGHQQHVIPNVVDQWQCAQLCLNGATQYRYGPNTPCYSAQYQHWSKTCTLSSENRRTKPEAFNPAVQEGVDYIENLCIADTPGLNNVGCWHEPIYNQTLLEIDLQIPNLSLEQCRERCETEEYFPCRGFTHKCSINPVYGGTDTICYLHSDDTLTSGPLMPARCSTYVEKLTCIDLTVECSASNMMLTLHYKAFMGRMFVVGHAEECGVSGYDQDVTGLVIPITTDPRALNKCGIFVAQSIGYGNRKLATTVIAIQRHPIIQTLGDRIVKVTCETEGTERLPRPLFNNITLDASFGVAEPPVQTSIINEVANISSTSPTARLRILDLGRGGAEASETVLGEELELRVDIYPPFNASMLRAGHLVASSGDGRDSLLLLDWRGCPPEPTNFPALTPTSPMVLSAIFKAFRFPSSPILKFSLILTICDGVCQPTDCGNGLNSWGRKKRAAAAAAAGNATNTTATVANDDLSKQEVPLQLTIIVRSLDREQVYNSTEMESMSYSIAESGDAVCASWSALVTVCLIFGFLQIIILAVCSFVFYRKKLLFNDQVSLNKDFQPRHAT